MNIYYVYAYNRSDGTPYYIGKGKDDRAYEYHRHISVPKNKAQIVFLEKNLSEEEAFVKEIELIAFHGRKNNGTGILRNLTDGGEGSSGRIPTDETRRKMSEAKTGKNHPNYGRTGEKNPFFGKKHSTEARQKMSEAKTGEKHPLFGKKHSDEVLQKMSDAKKAYWARRRPNNNLFIF